MRLRLLVLGLATAAGLSAVPSANAAPVFDHRCSGKTDTLCYDTDCTFVGDCTTYDCVVYSNYVNDPYFDVCVGLARSPQ